MKVNYHLKSRNKIPYFKRILILLVIFFIGAFTFSYLSPVIIRVVSPIWKAENAVGHSFQNLITKLNSQKNLAEENLMLRKKISSLELQLLDFSRNEVEKIAFLGEIGRTQDQDIVVAAVLSRPPQTPYDVIVIDAGSNNKIISGAEVSLPEGPIIGSILEVYPTKAKVKLFSANGVETNALLERGSVPVTLLGVGGGNFKIALPQDISVEKGDRIFSSGLVQHLLAIVGNVKSKPTDSFKEVLAKSPTNIFTLRLVVVRP